MLPLRITFEAALPAFFDVFAIVLVRSDYIGSTMPTFSY